MYKTNDDSKFLLQQLVFGLNVPEVVAKIMINRGVQNVEDGGILIDAKMKRVMPNPHQILDLPIAIERLLSAIYQKERILIYGDYDVDGVTSTCLVVRYLRSIGVNPEYYIPSRFSDGYGLNKEAFQLAKKKDIKLVIVVDSGTNAVEEVQIGNRMGIDTIIIDHHMPTGDLPVATAVINPNRLDQNEIERSKIKNMSAAGVTFIVLVALHKALKEANYFIDNNINEPDLKEIIGVAALGTVCDVMKLDGINRAIVNFSIKNQKFPTGILALMKQTNMGRIISADDFAFAIGPAINAAGRLGDTVSAIEMLLADDANTADELAYKLIQLNSERKKLEKEVFSEALEIIKKRKLDNNKMIFVYSANWHEGVIGVIAGKLKDIFGRPVFVATFDEKGSGKGSARSVSGVNLHEIIAEAKGSGALEKGGGHALAGGFSLNLEQADIFEQFLIKRNIQDPVEDLDIDFALPSCLNLEKLADDISILEPFGKGVERPLFCIENIAVESVIYTQDGNHLIVSVSSTFGDKIRAMIFNIHTKEELARSLKEIDIERVDIAFSIKQSQKYGVGMIIEDIRLSV